MKIFDQINNAVKLILFFSIGAFPNCHPGHEESKNTLEKVNLNPYHISGKYELTNVHTGKTVSQDNFKGKIQIIFFGFTSCQTICPVGLQNLKGVLKELGEDADKVVALFISIDLKRDSADAVKKYIRHFDERIIGLIGNEISLEKTLKSFRIESHKIAGKDGGVYQLDHPAVFMVLGKEGEFLASLPSSGDPKSLSVQMKNWF